MTTKTDTAKKSRGQRKPSRVWHLVTNQQNMLYMLAAGMVMGPAGFRDKYYSDLLSVYPGWIPLFRDKAEIPAGPLIRVTSERKHLLPCIASFDLSDLSCTARMLSQDGQIRNIAFPVPRKRKGDLALLVPPPLPMTLLTYISFRSSDDKQAFEHAVRDISNVDLSPYQVVVSESLFDVDTDIDLPEAPSQGQLLESREDKFPAFGQSLGGMLAMLYHVASRSDPGLAAYRCVIGETLEEHSGLTQDDPILATLSDWVRGDDMSDHSDIRARLFWGVAQSLVIVQSQNRPQTPIDAALMYLEGQIGFLQETEFALRLERLTSDMRGCLSLSGGTITELFKRHNGSLSRSLLLLCLREHCLELLEFSHPLLSDIEYTVAGILFGIRAGWLQVPVELRYPEMSAYIEYRMAKAELGDTFLLSAAPSRPKPLREHFVSSSSEWNNHQRELAQALAQECNWNDCIQTCVTLAGGDFPENFERKGEQVILPGRVTNVTEQIDRTKFLDRLGQWPPIDRRIESKIRKRFLSLKNTKAEEDKGDASCE